MSTCRELLDSRHASMKCLSRERDLRFPSRLENSPSLVSLVFKLICSYTQSLGRLVRSGAAHAQSLSLVRVPPEPPSTANLHFLDRSAMRLSWLQVITDGQRSGTRRALPMPRRAQYTPRLHSCVSRPHDRWSVRTVPANLLNRRSIRR